MSDHVSGAASAESSPPERDVHGIAGILCWVALAALLVVFLRTAWLSDDAYISFRTIRNFVNGDGLRWNVAERVQSFTHPLWALLLSAAHFVTRDLYYTTFALSLGISLWVARQVAWRIAPTRLAGFTCLVALLSSRSFVDYSSSGLENPLTHLLLVSFAGRYLLGDKDHPRRLLWLTVLASLCALNRLDTVLLTTPLLLYVLLTEGRTVRGVLHVAVGYAPLAVWEAFSLVYYGFPFPNTAYAKIPAGIELISRLDKGSGYLLSSILYDPVGMLVLAGGIAVPVVLRIRRLLPLSVGCLLYGLYTVYVGGDFMAGRFFSAAIVLSVVILSAAVSLPARPRWAFAPAVLILALGFVTGPRATLVAGSDYGTQWHWRKNIDRRGVADERAVYFKITGLLRANKPLSTPHHAWFDMGSRVKPGSVAIAATLGFFGWAAPRDAYLIDQLALSDPFLARLPPKNTTTWRPGHLDREIPPGYRASRASGDNKLRNPWLAELYDRITLVTMGPIWSGERFAAIWQLNTGGADRLKAHAGDVTIAAATLRRQVADGTAWDARGTARIPAGKAGYIWFAAAQKGSALRLAVDCNDRYAVTLLRGMDPVHELTIEATPGAAGLVNHRVELPDTVAVSLERGGIDGIAIRALDGDGRYSIGHLAIE